MLQFSEAFDEILSEKIIIDSHLSISLDNINRKYFNNTRRLKIGWEKLPASIWAHFRTAEHTIGINISVKNLNTWTPKPPECFLDYLIFHETLHDIYPTVVKNGRNYDHPPEFKRHERSFPEFQKIRDWENLEAKARVSSKFCKFGSDEYQEIFKKLTGSAVNANLAYFTCYGDILKNKWAVLGIDPLRRKYRLQAICLFDSAIEWFKLDQCVWR